MLFKMKKLQNEIQILKANDNLCITNYRSNNNLKMIHQNDILSIFLGFICYGTVVFPCSSLVMILSRTASHTNYAIFAFISFDRQKKLYLDVVIKSLFTN